MQEINVMTFSVMAAKKQQMGLDGKAGLPGEPGWQVRREITTKFLLAQQYDFFGLQHCYVDQYDCDLDAARYFREQLEIYGVPYGIVNRSQSEDPNKGDSTPLYYRKDEWEIDPDEYGFQWFDAPYPPPSAGGGGGRLFVYGLFHSKVPWGGRGRVSVYVYNTRLRNQHSDLLDEYRVKCVDQLFRHIAARDVNAPVVVLADTNCKKVDCLTDRFLFGQSVDVNGRVYVPAVTMQDAYVHVNPGSHGQVSTQHGYKTAGSIKGRERNDRVLVSRGVSVARSRIVTVNEYGMYPSYHYPVDAKLVLLQ